MAGKNEVGILIRETRQRKELTQEQVAALMREHGLGTTGNYVGKLENGFAVPSRETMRVLGLVLDIPIGRLYDAAGMLEGVLRPRADAEEADWLDRMVEDLRDDPEFAESYRQMEERDDPPEVRAAQLRGVARVVRDSVSLLVLQPAQGR
jgi:transcriptional regulator with XRE-family HTH domain